MVLVFCAYAREQSGAGDRARRLFGLLRWLYKLDMILVVKNHPCAFVPHVDDFEMICIEGSNSMHEFGAWVEGLDFLSRRTNVGPHVILANDTLWSHGALSLGQEIDLIMDSFFSRRPYKLKGFPSRIPVPECRIGSQVMEYNLCSKILIAEPGLLSSRLIERAYAEAQRFVSGQAPGELSANYFAFLNAWLHGQHEPRWYRACPVSEMAPNERLVKATMIIAEHLLTAAAGDRVAPIGRSQLRRFGSWTQKLAG